MSLFKNPARFLCLILTLSFPLEAAGKNSKVFGYRYHALWSTAIRFLRADRNYTITDQDKENGYIIFVFPGSGAVKECHGSLELLKFVDDQGYKKVRAQLSIAHQPSYIEIELLDRLEEKLGEELGSPPPAERPKKSPEEKKPEEKPTPKPPATPPA